MVWCFCFQAAPGCLDFWGCLCELCHRSIPPLSPVTLQPSSQPPWDCSVHLSSMARPTGTRPEPVPALGEPGTRPHFPLGALVAVMAAGTWCFQLGHPQAKSNPQCHGHRGQAGRRVEFGFSAENTAKIGSGPQFPFWLVGAVPFLWQLRKAEDGF